MNNQQNQIDIIAASQFIESWQKLDSDNIIQAYFF
jgi:hypothetical protein